MVWRVAVAAFCRSRIPSRALSKVRNHGTLSRESRSHQVGGSRGIADLDPQTFANFKRAWRAGSYHMRDSACSVSNRPVRPVAPRTGNFIELTLISVFVQA
jgi:hypothetical protein